MKSIFSHKNWPPQIRLANELKKNFLVKTLVNVEPLVGDDKGWSLKDQSIFIAWVGADEKGVLFPNFC